MKLQCIQNLHEKIFFFHITFNKVVKSFLQNDTKTKIYPNQQSFVIFSSWLYILLFLETGGTPNFWRLAPYNHWHCGGWRCFLRKGNISTSTEKKPLSRDILFSKVWSWMLLDAAKQCGEPVVFSSIQGQFHMILENKHGIFSSNNSLCIFSENSALHSQKVVLFVEEESKNDPSLGA